MTTNNEKPTASDLSASAGSHQFSRDDLKAFAGSACISIYDDFDAAEITQEPKSVQLAWSYGRMLKGENRRTRTNSDLLRDSGVLSLFSYSFRKNFKATS